MSHSFENFLNSQQLKGILSHITLSSSPDLTVTFSNIFISPTDLLLIYSIIIYLEKVGNYNKIIFIVKKH